MDIEEEHQAELVIQEIILELCTVLNSYGYPDVSIGAMMRVLGVSEEAAAKHDDNYIKLGEEFDKMLDELDVSENGYPYIPASETIH